MGAKKDPKKDAKAPTKTPKKKEGGGGGKAKKKKWSKGKSRDKLNNLVLFDKVFLYLSYYIQHCFNCRPSDSTVPTDAGIEPRAVATDALAVRRPNH
jgi:hypothetical protein